MTTISVNNNLYIISDNNDVIKLIKNELGYESSQLIINMIDKHEQEIKTTAEDAVDIFIENYEHNLSKHRDYLEKLVDEFDTLNSSQVKERLCNLLKKL